MGLEPIEWNRAIQLTGSSSPSIKDAIEAAFKDAQAVVVLLTPDDIAKLKDEFLKPTPEDQFYESKLTGQARPNVIFETGLAFGHRPNRTILVEVGETKPFSDISGLHRVQLSNNPASRMDLYQRLKSAGCDVDDHNRDWLSEGNFSIPSVNHSYELRTSGRLVHGPASGEEGEEADTRETRARYRIVAYLAGFVISSIEHLDPFVRLNLLKTEWYLHTTTKSMTLIVRTVRGREIRVSTTVEGDWPKGGSGGYARELAESLVEKLQQQI